MNNKAILKFPLSVQDTTILNMPVGSEVLHFDSQYDVLNIWAICDTKAVVTEERVFFLAVTGERLPQGNLKYIGTVLLSSGTMVVHLFEVIKP